LKDLCERDLSSIVVIFCISDMDHINISSKQYLQAIKDALNFRQISVLKVLYSFPNSTATAKELAAVINPSSPAPIVANRQIGVIGKAIAQYLDITPPIYFDGHDDKPAYFAVVGWVGIGHRGWKMHVNLQEALLELELVRPSDRGASSLEQLPTEELFKHGRSLFEGKVVVVQVDRYERNGQARAKCIEHYGVKCQGCGFDFGSKYGRMAEGYIQVHHVRSLSEVGKEYEVDPIRDLIPLCANCHCVVHLYNPVMSIDELKISFKR
jgi:predicted HNH restriction endonuclease